MNIKLKITAQRTFLDYHTARDESTEESGTIQLSSTGPGKARELQV